MMHSSLLLFFSAAILLLLLTVPQAQAQEGGNLDFLNGGTAAGSDGDNEFGFLLIEECKSAATIAALCFVENEKSCGQGCNETVADLGTGAGSTEATCSTAQSQVCTFVECCQTCKTQFLDYVTCLYKYSDESVSLDCSFECKEATATNGGTSANGNSAASMRMEKSVFVTTSLLFVLAHLLSV